jgi:general secretion pathway protein C
MQFDLSGWGTRPSGWTGRQQASAIRFVEVLLWILLALQGARLVWAIVTPSGPVGDVAALRNASTINETGGAVGDPFFRLAVGSGNAAVTSLPLKLFGVRVDEAMGRGSAIIATPDGVQSSFGIGEEIMTGATLKAVMRDSVTIDRGGVEEKLYIDQSVSVADVTSTLAARPTTATGGGAQMVRSQTGPADGPLSVTQIRNDIDFVPQTDGGRVTGFAVSPRGSGAAFGAIGLQAGDVVVSVNGMPVTSPGTMADQFGAMNAGSQLTLEVERGGGKTMVSTRLGQ